MIASVGSFHSLPADRLHSVFLDLMPHVERQARRAFHDLTCPDLLGDKVAECLALTWRRLLRLDRHKIPVSRRSRRAFAFRVARAVQAGRRLAGRDRARDVLSPRAQRRHGFTVTGLPAAAETW